MKSGAHPQDERAGDLDRHVRGLLGGRQVRQPGARRDGLPLMKKLKVEDHVAVAVMYNDTKHPHVHLLICTVNPTTEPRGALLPRRQRRLRASPRSTNGTIGVGGFARCSTHMLLPSR